MKRFVSLFLVLCMLLTGTACFAEESTEVKGTATVNWDSTPVEHEDFTDLGDYIIDLGVFTPEDIEKGIAIVNSKVDPNATACTGIVKRNSKGEVIMGRNMDLEVSNFAAYIAHFVGGKYQAVGFNYNNHGEYTYADIQAMDSLPDGYREMQAASVMDVFNEEGLYMQTNMRTGDGHLTTETNPGGKRVTMGGMGAIVATNCGTVAEALEFIRTELDVYSAGATKDGAARAGWDGAVMIGDATGEYGIIEFVNNQMYYTPYANGHGNAYINPDLYQYNEYCAGFGRLALAQQAMIGAETADDMMEAIHKADWYHEVQDIQYSYKDEQGNVHFVDKDGNPSIDYRSEFGRMFCVNDEGHYVPNDDPWIQTLTAVATGEAFEYLDPANYDLYATTSEEIQKVLVEIEEALKEYDLGILDPYAVSDAFSFLDSTRYSLYDIEDLQNVVGELEDALQEYTYDTAETLYEAELEAMSGWQAALQDFGFDVLGSLSEEDVTALVEWADGMHEVVTTAWDNLTEAEQKELTEWAEGVQEDVTSILESAYEAGQEALTEWKECLQAAAFEILERYHMNSTIMWLTDNENFDEVKQAVTDYFNGLNAFELLEQFLAGNEQPARDSGEIFTTGMNFGVNCNEKYLKVRFLENPDCVYEYQW